MKYEFHDPVARLRKVWRKSGHDDKDFDYMKLQVARALESDALRSTGQMVDWACETYAFGAFHREPRYVFVGARLSEFIDNMKVKDVPPDYVLPAVRLLPDVFELVWGDGSTSLCLACDRDHMLAHMTEVNREFASRIGAVEGPVDVCHRLWGVNVWVEGLLPEEQERVQGVTIVPHLVTWLPDNKFALALSEDFDKTACTNPSGWLVKMGADELETVGVARIRLLKLLVYLASYPEQLKDGIVGDCAFGGLQPKHVTRSSSTIVIRKEHHSVCSHMRCEYFRLYPTRKDGTRRPGLVHVRSAIVNGKAQTATEKGG